MDPSTFDSPSEEETELEAVCKEASAEVDLFLEIVLKFISTGDRLFRAYIEMISVANDDERENLIQAVSSFSLFQSLSLSFVFWERKKMGIYKQTSTMCTCPSIVCLLND